MLRITGKMMQLAGLIVLPVAMLMQLTAGIRAPTGGISVSAMLIMLIGGVALFYLGRMLEGIGQS